MDQRFRPRQRIKSRGDFKKAFDQGTRVSGRYLTLFVVPNAGPGPRLGVVASRKLGSAVRRNRCKRRARELFRRNPLPGNPGLDIVVLPRRELLDAAFATVEADYTHALRRVRRLAAQSSPSGRPVGSPHDPDPHQRV